MRHSEASVADVGEHFSDFDTKPLAGDFLGWSFLHNVFEKRAVLRTNLLRIHEIPRWFVASRTLKEVKPLKAARMFLAAHSG